MSCELKELDKLEVGIEGFDSIADGGLPVGRTTLVAGTAGSGKTMLALQFIMVGIDRYDQSGVIATFEEATEELKQNVASLGWTWMGSSKTAGSRSSAFHLNRVKRSSRQVFSILPR